MVGIYVFQAGHPFTQMGKENACDEYEHLWSYKRHRRLVSDLLDMESGCKIPLGPQKLIAREAAAINKGLDALFDIDLKRSIPISFLHPAIQDVLHRFSDAHVYLKRHIFGNLTGLGVENIDSIVVDGRKAYAVRKQPIPPTVLMPSAAEARRLKLVNSVFKTGFQLHSANVHEIRIVQSFAVTLKCISPRHGISPERRNTTHLIAALCEFWPELRSVSFSLSPQIERAISSANVDRRESPRSTFNRVAIKALVALLTVCGFCDRQLTLHLIGFCLSADETSKDDIITPALSVFLATQKQYFSPTIGYLTVLRMTTELCQIIKCISGDNPIVNRTSSEQYMIHTMGEKTWFNALVTGIGLAALDSMERCGRFLLEFKYSSAIVCDSTTIMKRFL